MSKSSINNDDDLTEPLLVKAVEAPSSPSSLVRTKILTSIFGCWMALLSQAILSLAMWDESILKGSTLAIVVFSLTWSFWTCVILFLGMMAFASARGSSTPTNDEETFQVEAQYVVASLLTISAIWIMDSVMVSLIAIVCLCILVAKMDQGIMGSYSLVAGTLGLIFGACSQFVLSLLMWKDASMSRPVIHHIILFSLVWSLLTVCLTFVGCMSLRWIVFNNRRAILRMEAFYVAMTLIGICGAWVFLDIAAGIPEQIVPSILMLIASLATFAVILRCFPEDACLEEEEEMATATMDEIKAEEGILVV